MLKGFGLGGDPSYFAPPSMPCIPVARHTRYKFVDGKSYVFLKLNFDIKHISTLLPIPST